MNKPLDLSTENEMTLLNKQFVQTKDQDLGMHKSYEWTSEFFKFGLYFDRGYYDCYLTPIKSPINGITLLSLLKYLNNDHTFYDKELKEANLWNTLSSNQYIDLIVSYYDQLCYFFENYNKESYDKLAAFLKI